MNLDKYIALIKKGEVVAFPTETVYGLGADAWNPSAIQKVFKIKGRPSDNPLIVHVSNLEQVLDFVISIPKEAQELIDAFWPGSLSIILPKKPEVLDSVTAGLDTVAIRMPDHPIALDFISKTGPLVAPSANTSGNPSPTKASHVMQDFGSNFPIIDGESTHVGLESTVIDLSEDEPTILRPGSISRKQIEDVLGNGIHESFFTKLVRPKSPGQKYSHYKPNAEVKWLDEKDDLSDTTVLFLLTESDHIAPNLVNYNGDLALLAKELYDRFRQADLEGYSKIAIQPFNNSDHSIVSALLNRINRAIS